MDESIYTSIIISIGLQYVRNDRIIYQSISNDGVASQSMMYRLKDITKHHNNWEARNDNKQM